MTTSVRPTVRAVHTCPAAVRSTIPEARTRIPPVSLPRQGFQLLLQPLHQKGRASEDGEVESILLVDMAATSHQTMPTNTAKHPHGGGVGWESGEGTTFRRARGNPHPATAPGSQSLPHVRRRRSSRRMFSSEQEGPSPNQTVINENPNHPAESGDRTLPRNHPYLSDARALARLSLGILQLRLELIPRCTERGKLFAVTLLLFLFVARRSSRGEGCTESERLNGRTGRLKDSKD